MNLKMIQNKFCDLSAYSEKLDNISFQLQYQEILSSNLTSYSRLLILQVFTKTDK
ncbi:hypothetical protein HNP25_002386 [Arcicella rosea]|uniref:Uncharacterized protein n=1 Tax=Arcicella rosea TaxID=502909 RepID=A0A841ESS9_9BACT|nr:hypothetical protein [Arcicella rosea]